jgi:predicted RNase H-like HicB family nuclease
VSSIKIIVERHPDGYVAYPIGHKGVVVGEGDSYDEALSDVKSAIRFHIETFGPDSMASDSVLEAFVTEADLAKK